MKNANVIRKDEKDRRIITINGEVKGDFAKLDSGLYKYVFDCDDELVPTADGGWKVVDGDNEVILPSDRKWKIVFSDNSKILPVPYKGIKSGEWVLIQGSGFLKGVAMICLQGSDIFGVPREGEYEEDPLKAFMDKEHKKELAKKMSRPARSDDDDEENVMRALRNDNGDLLGF